MVERKDADRIDPIHAKMAAEALDGGRDGPSVVTGELEAAAGSSARYHEPAAITGIPSRFHDAFQFLALGCLPRGIAEEYVSISADSLGKRGHETPVVRLLDNPARSLG
jgi:hypothetical protein